MKGWLHDALNKIKTWSVLLSMRPLVGGLEIADTALRFALWNGKAWEIVGVPLVPGILVEGEVRDRDAFIAALQLLRSQIIGPKKTNKKEKISVIVSLSSVRIYTQIFNLPFVKGANLEEAVALNLKMASPAELETTYSDWELIDNKNTESETQMEILAAFLEKEVVDSLISALRDVFFVPIVVEPNSFSLTRALREMGDSFEKEKSIIVARIAESGINIMIIRHAKVHFNYFTSWWELQGKGEGVFLIELRSAVTQSLHRVLNFYRSHWKESLVEILVSAPGLEEEIINEVKTNFDVPARGLTLQIAQFVGSEWFTAIGAGLRGNLPRRKDTEISLLGIDAREEFRREQITAFIKFWRVLIPASLGFLLIVFIGASLFIMNIHRYLEQELIHRPPSSPDISALEQEALSFNLLVNKMRVAERGVSQRSRMVDIIIALASEHEITLSRLVVSGGDVAGIIGGSTNSEENIRSFKDALHANPMFQNVEVPITGIKKERDTYFFSLNFSIASANTR